MNTEEWSTGFHNISIHYIDKLIQIKTDKALMEFLAQPENGSFELADHIKRTYSSIYGKELQISRDSLSIEILIHAYLDVFLRFFEKLQKVNSTIIKKVVAYMKEIESYTEIIDSGEASLCRHRRCQFQCAGL